MQRVRILVGGPIAEWPQTLKDGQLAGPWLAADRGALRLLNVGITPELAVGDFDSLTVAERQLVEERVTHLVTVQPEKDETDLELLLDAIKEDPELETIEIYGATGGRLDQLLSNLWIMTQDRFHNILEKVKIIDRVNEVIFFHPGAHTIKHLPGMQYLGFMNLTPVENLTLVDEKYHLTNWSSAVPYSYSSNEFAGEINHFTFDAGIVAVIQSRDLNGQTGD